MTFNKHAPVCLKQRLKSIGSTGLDERPASCVGRRHWAVSFVAY